MTQTPIRVQLSRRKGWRMPDNTVSVARPGKWGNPFKLGDNASQFSTALPNEVTSTEQAVACFRYYTDTWNALRNEKWAEPLRGKNLACWCKLDAPCHADVLLEIANAPPSRPTTNEGEIG
jgi:hypothetical protein